MSNEMELVSQGTGTRYAIIRRHSDYKVWDVANTAWATYSAGSINNYDVALTARGGDVWQADFPTDISSGTRVRVIYYKQIGASPSDTDDLLLASQDTTWNGSALTGTSTVTLSSYALTTLESLKRYLRITASTDDTILTEVINAVTARMESICGRQFAARDYREWVSGTGNTPSLVIRNRPIVNLYRVAYGSCAAISVKATGFARATINSNATGLQLYSVSTAGVTTKTNLTYATYPSSGTLATAIGAVSGWSATKLVDCASLDLNEISVGCLNTAANLTYPDTDTGINGVDRTRGIIHAMTAADTYPVTTAPLLTFPGLRNYLVEYNGGYATIPDDLSMLCNELSSEVYRQGQHDPLMKSESLGDWSYSLAGSIELTDSQTARLMRYADVTMGGAA